MLYWALMQDEVDELHIQCDDGFRHPEGNEDAPYVSWQEAHSANVLFLHGALHLFDAGHEITKYTWSKTDTAIIDQIRAALDEEKYPLFVAEGHSQAKLEKIKHSAYLHRALRSFAQISGSLFVYGHSFDDNDFHILKQIPSGKITDLFVSIYGDPASDGNKAIIERANELRRMRSEIPRKRGLNIHFFDAESAHIWGL
jgi:hypothetical protein